jgi:uncharacterized protein (DUF885 family)
MGFGGLSGRRNSKLEIRAASDVHGANFIVGDPGMGGQRKANCGKGQEVVSPGPAGVQWGAILKTKGRFRMRFSVFVALLIFAGCAAVIAAPPQQTDVAARRKALNDLIAERWEYSLRTSPITASFFGDKRWNDKLDDFSQQFIDDDLAQAKKDLARFEAIDTTGFPEQEALSKALMVRDLRMELEDARFKPWEMPVSQTGGLHIDLPQLVSILSFKTMRDYQDYISRLRQIPRLFDKTEIQMRKGMADGLMPPRNLLEEVVGQASGIANKAPDASPFAQPFTKFPDSISAAEQKRLRDEGLAAIREAVTPA